jgi:carbonic anhydrase
MLVAEFDEFKRANERYAASFDRGDLPMPPARHVAVVTCMDARLHPEKSLAISERLLGTTEVVVIHHTDSCDTE